MTEAMGIARVTAMAEAIFGDRLKAHRWLAKPKHRFGGLAPLAVSATPEGAMEVEAVLLQLKEGLAL